MRELRALREVRIVHTNLLVSETPAMTGGCC